MKVYLPFCYTLVHSDSWWYPNFQEQWLEKRKVLWIMVAFATKCQRSTAYNTITMIFIATIDLFVFHVVVWRNVIQPNDNETHFNRRALLNNWSNAPKPLNGLDRAIVDNHSFNFYKANNPKNFAIKNMYYSLLLVNCSQCPTDVKFDRLNF